MKFNPSVIFAVTPTPEICEAANRAGVRLVEIFHSQSYFSLEEIYSLHPSRDVHAIPWACIVYDRLSCNTIRDSGINTNIFTGIPPLYSAIPRGYFGRRSHFDLSKRQKEVLEKFRKIFVVALQWGYDGEFEKFRGVIKNGIIHESILELMVHGDDDILWIPRLHPIQMQSWKYQRHREFIRSLEYMHANIISADFAKHPLPSILNFSDGLITASSSSVYDAAWCGVSSFAFCPTLMAGGPNERFAEDLVDKKFLTKGDLSVNSLGEFTRTAHRVIPLTFDYLENDFFNLVDKILNEGKA